MSCILRITGKNFDVDDFIFQSKISPFTIYYKGSPEFKSKPDGKKNEHSGCHIKISSANFSEFNKQVSDAIKYLQEHQEELQHIVLTHGIEYATLDFGVKYDPDKFVQSKYFPKDLIKLSGELGIGIEISIYQPSE